MTLLEKIYAKVDYGRNKTRARKALGIQVHYVCTLIPPFYDGDSVYSPSQGAISGPFQWIRHHSGTFIPPTTRRPTASNPEITSTTGGWGMYLIRPSIRMQKFFYVRGQINHEIN